MSWVVSFVFCPAAGFDLQAAAARGRAAAEKRLRRQGVMLSSGSDMDIELELQAGYPNVSSVDSDFEIDLDNSSVRFVCSTQRQSILHSRLDGLVLRLLSKRWARTTCPLESVSLKLMMFMRNYDRHQRQ